LGIITSPKKSIRAYLRSRQALLVIRREENEKIRAFNALNATGALEESSIFDGMPLAMVRLDLSSVQHVTRGSIDCMSQSRLYALPAD
jgi:hypothetical protein